MIQLEKTRNNEISNAKTELEKTEIELRMEVRRAESIATQEASKQRIKVENDLNIKRLVANNTLEIALLEAQMTTKKADAERETQLMMLEAKGELFQKYPKLYQLELARLRKQALSSIQESYVSESMVPSYFGLGDSSGQPMKPLFFQSTV